MSSGGNKRSEMFQSIGTIAALCISVFALFTSIYEARIMKSQQKSMVWPYLSVSPQYNSEGFNLQVFNNGTGPALVKSVEITYREKAIANLDELFQAAKPGYSPDYSTLRSNFLNGYVFKSGEERVVFGMPWTDETRELVKNLEKNARMRIYYESVLGDGWVVDSKDGSHKKEKFKAKVEFKN